MKTEENKKDTTPQPSIARLLREDFEKRKQQLADFLTNQCQRLSPQNRKLFFLFIGIVLGTAILTISYHAVKTTSAFDFLRKEKVMPIPAAPTDSEEIVTPEEYQIIVDFARTLDSLKQRDPFSYRKLMDIHPGLLDSMNLLIHIYQSTY